MQAVQALDKYYDSIYDTNVPKNVLNRSRVITLDVDLFTDISGPYVDESACAAWLLCDRHDPESTAYTVVEDNGAAKAVTYGELHNESIRLANGFRDLGVQPGTRVATLLHKGPELVTTMLAVWRLGAVYVPLFTAFAGKAVEFRIHTAQVGLVITDTAQRGKLPDLTGSPIKVVVVDGASEPEDVDYQTLLATASSNDLETFVQGPDGPLVHMFTSGTTGSPKGVIHPLRQAAGWHSYLKYGLGVASDDVYWCAADPGWAYGLYAGIVAPLANGTGAILQAGAFEPTAAWKIIENLGVTNLTAAPTVYRALGTHFPVLPSRTRLKRLSSAGEPLTPEVNVWAGEQLGLEVHDHFGQTEVGMVFGNVHHPAIARKVVPGSMGYPLPGWAATVLGEDEAMELAPGVMGRVAIDVAKSPAMTFRSYQDPSQTASRFTRDGRFYLLGDLGHRDADGAFHFASRDDDVIIMAGYRIGPFEIESMLSEHPAVAESAAIAAPDADRGEVLEAYVVLSDGWEPSDALRQDLQGFVKNHYAAHAYPRSIHFIQELPKTPSGKIQRYVLRQQRRSEVEKAGQL